MKKTQIFSISLSSFAMVTLMACTGSVDDSLAEKEAAIDAEKRRQEQITRELEEIRQQELDEQQRLREEKITSTTQAWEDFEAVNAYLDRQPNDIGISEASLAIKNAATSIASISTANVDPRLAELINESQELFTDFHQFIDAYRQKLAELDNAPNMDALNSCVTSAIGAETIEGGILKCLAGGAVSGTISAAEANRLRTQVEEDAAVTGQQLQVRLEQLVTKYAQMPEYLDSEYGIKVDHTVTIQPTEQPTPQEELTVVKAILENAPSSGQIPLLNAPDGASLGYGINDDVVEVLGSVPGWYNVRFPRSEAEGWIHQDYVKRLN
jgi:hypothetical protein